MSLTVPELVFWGSVTFAAPLVLALYPLFKFHTSERMLHLMLGFSAGILGGVTFVDILPEAFEAAKELSVAVSYVSYGVAVGFFLLLVVDKTQQAGGEAHRGGHFHIHQQLTTLEPRHATAGLSALSVHGFMDGFVIPIGFAAGAQIGFIITVAIVLHQIPDSFAALSLALGTTQSKRKALTYVLITALDTPIGIILGVLFASVGGVMVPIGLGISAGTFIFFSASDLVPELQQKARSPLVIPSMVFGYVLVAILAVLLPPV